MMEGRFEFTLPFNEPALLLSVLRDFSSAVGTLGDVQPERDTRTHLILPSGEKTILNALHKSNL